jgi:hypothetical protein
MQKTLIPIEMQFKGEKKVEGQRFQYLVNPTPDQEFWSPVFNSVEELDKWFEKAFGERPDVVDMWNQ